jgi:hypothetical protein
MQKWEYDIVHLPTGKDAVKLLNSYGEEGWELAAICDGVAYLKRQCSDKVGCCSKEDEKC